MKRFLLLLLPALLFAGGNKDEKEGQVNLEFISWRVEDVPVYQELISRFQQEKPGINITFTAIKSSEYNTALATRFRGGNAPDIIHLRAYGNLEQYVEPGYLMTLGDKIPELKRYSDLAIQGVTSQSTGKIYGVPYAAMKLLIHYNKDIYQELGLSEPETWDQFLANLQVIKDDGRYQPLANGGKVGWNLEVLHGVVSPNFYGGTNFFNEIVAGKTTFEDPRYLRSLDVLLDLKPYLPASFLSVEYTDSQMAFINGLAAHFIGGSWETAYFRSQNPELKQDVFPAPAAKPGGPRYVSAYVDGSFGASANTKHPEEVVAFLRFLTRPENNQFLADKLGVEMLAPGVKFKDPITRKIVSFPLTTPYIYLVGFRYQQPTGSALIQSELQGFFSGKVSSAEVGRRVTEGIRTYYKPFQK